LKTGRLAYFLSALAAVAVLCGCEDSGGHKWLGSGHDFGANNPDMHVAIGDSITWGVGANTSYPSILEGMLGKTVFNEGVPGQRTGPGASRTPGILAGYRPGFLLILYGANDVIHGGDLALVIEQLRSMIHAARNNRTIPVLATITPHISWREGIYGAAVTDLNIQIRGLASEEGVKLVDLERAFAGHPEYMLYDGLHPNDDGQAIIAAKFHDVLRR